ncbi:MAG TPA: thioredoxin domain-containing protein [Anaerolineales bacterium]|nr:thioredoxin domain-containing protein [Anaerolineales bacterium]
MTLEKKSKRQERREKMHRQEMRSRLTTIGLITVGALLLVIAFIWPQFTTIDDLIIPEAKTLPNPDGLGLGDPNAPVVIDVFEDFQCPACQYFSDSIEPLIIEYLVTPGKARLVYHNYPFIDGEGASNGGESDQAANASMCANEQGKFWEMKAILYANWNGENQGNLSNRRLTAMAEAINLDMDAFNACFSDNKYRDDIQASFDLGQEYGVSGTPSVFVNKAKVGEPGKIPTFQEIAVAVDAIVNAGQ